MHIFTYCAYFTFMVLLYKHKQGGKMYPEKYLVEIMHANTCTDLLPIVESLERDMNNIPEPKRVEIKDALLKAEIRLSGEHETNEYKKIHNLVIRIIKFLQATQSRVTRYFNPRNNDLIITLN